MTLAREKTILDKVRLSIISYYEFGRNQNRSFTIIFNDCWGAEVYVDTSIQYLTPLCGFNDFTSYFSAGRMEQNNSTTCFKALRGKSFAKAFQRKN